MRPLVTSIQFVRLPDRRRIPERRATWRGGRRDVDWMGGILDWLVAAVMPNQPEVKAHPLPPARPTWTALLTTVTSRARTKPHS
jgi:hypothetical protein